MNKNGKIDIGIIAQDWWASDIIRRGSSASSGLAARIRRGDAVAILSEPSVHRLAGRLGIGPEGAESLVTLCSLLAEVRTDDPRRLAERIGGDDPALSHARFTKLMRAEGEDLVNLLRRAILAADRRCNISALAWDILRWDAAKPRWCFQYFGETQER